MTSEIGFQIFFDSLKLIFLNPIYTTRRRGYTDAKMSRQKLGLCRERLRWCRNKCRQEYWDDVNLGLLPMHCLSTHSQHVGSRELTTIGNDVANRLLPTLLNTSAYMTIDTTALEVAPRLKPFATYKLRQENFIIILYSILILFICKLESNPI